MYINRMKNWWLRTCAHLQKNISKICDFRFFSFDLCTDIILKQLNKIKKTVFFCFFHFSCFSVVSHFVSPLCFPIVVPVALPHRWVEVLEPTVAKTDDLGLVPIFKKIFQKSVIFIFSFDLHTDIILKQFNKWKNTNIFFTFLCCFPFCSPVVLPYCGPRCITPLHYPVVGSKSSSQPLRKLMT